VIGNHWFYLVILLVVVLIIFGPGRLPELGSGLGRAMREFRKATSEITNEVTAAAKPEPPAPSETPKSSTSETKPPGN